mmetsp:Transcript_18881/g.25975  ORF Transcript_18881/g.25975 Transcript_18881/m.25975 type:complete len:84 (-) Transcript_18881:502-753(-)
MALLLLATFSDVTSMDGDLSNHSGRPSIANMGPPSIPALTSHVYPLVGEANTKYVRSVTGNVKMTAAVMRRFVTGTPSLAPEK